MRSTFIQSFMSHVCFYMMIQITSQEECGGNRNGTSGSVTSPYYPNNYDGNRNCIYTIYSRTTLIRLVFVDIDLEKGYDKVKAFDTSGHLLVSLEGWKPWQVMQPSNYYRLQFTSDPYKTGRGFNATWTAAAASIKETLHGGCGNDETSVRMSSSGLSLGHLEALNSDTVYQCMYVCSIDVFCVAFNYVDRNCSLFLNLKGDNIPANIFMLM